MSSMAESDEHDEIMIGALVSTVWLVLRHRVNAALAAAGFDDYRPTHESVFQWLGPDGERVSDLAWMNRTARRAVVEAHVGWVRALRLTRVVHQRFHPLLRSGG